MSLEKIYQDYATFRQEHYYNFPNEIWEIIGRFYFDNIDVILFRLFYSGSDEFLEEYIRMFKSVLTKDELNDALWRLTCLWFQQEGVSYQKQLEAHIPRLTLLIELGAEPFSIVKDEGDICFTDAISNGNLPLARWFLKDHPLTQLNDKEFLIALTNKETWTTLGMVHQEVFDHYICECAAMYDCEETIMEILYDFV